ncbi:MAG: cytoplasmic protein [bacterium]|nr:cytoplasmic protein [bacterium]
MTRPELTKDLSAEEFMAWYWLKEELASFCSAHGLPTGGSKEAIAGRIRLFLETGEIKKPVSKGTRPKAEMPKQFKRETVVGEGWRCSQELRKFFEKELGEKFRYDGPMRDFIKKDGIGKTLGDAIALWHEEKKKPREEKEIAKQFEYNRFVREFFKENKGASLQDAIAAWRKKRDGRKK